MEGREGAIRTLIEEEGMQEVVPVDAEHALKGRVEHALNRWVTCGQASASG